MMLKSYMPAQCSRILNGNSIFRFQKTICQLCVLILVAYLPTANLTGLTVQAYQMVSSRFAILTEKGVALGHSGQLCVAFARDFIRLMSEALKHMDLGKWGLDAKEPR